MIDYRELLKFYIWHVGQCEGIDFLDSDWRAGNMPDEYWKELQKISKEDL